MDRSIIWELKDIKNELVNMIDSSLEPQILSLKLDNEKKKLKSLLDEHSDVISDIREYYSALTGVVSHLSNAEKAIMRGDKEEFNKLLRDPPIEVLCRVVNELEERHPRKIGFTIQ